MIQEATPIPILLVDDNPADIDLMVRALRTCNSEGQIAIASDGQKALSYLRSAERPERLLVLLDLNMPKMSGFDVLEEIKTDDELCGVPVAILTTSSRPSDIHRSYRRGASSFITKPFDLDDLLEVAEVLWSYWGNAVEVP